MMMAVIENIPILQPRYKVTLFKTVQRETIDGEEKVSVRYGATAKTIDLTQFLTDQSTISTSKSVREPAGGFSITVSDQPYSVPAGVDTLAGIVEPMDIVEIRFAHHPNGSSEPPVIMRGFVSDVSRSEFVDNDGRPVRTVTIAGQDYGKLWQMLQLFYGPWYVIGQDIISAYAMFERFGAGAKIGQSGADFLKETFDKILNPYVKDIVSGNSDNPSTIEVKALQKHGVTSISGTQNQEGALYDLLRRFLDVGVWNELFITEDDEKVYCIYRPNPYLDVHGKPIDPDTKEPVAFSSASTDPTTLVYYDVPAEDIRSINVSRSDSNVANYYWVRAPRYEMVSDIYQKQAGATSGDKKTIGLTDYVNTKGKLYGIRKMEVTTEMGGDDVSNTASGVSEQEKIKRDTSVANWIKNRRQMLVEMNRDNVLLERGSMAIKGNENIRAGNYVKVRRGTFTALYYVVQVEHQFSPFNNFVSVLQVDRGLGFVERLRKNGGPESPYYSEQASS
jgi:hypothetical protein